MRCGLYEIDITPKLGENIPGYFEARPACGIREPLFARALACSNEAGAAFVLVNMDTISCDARTSSRARARFEQLTGVSGANMMVSATHTHTGGPVDEFVPGTANYEYMDWMARSRGGRCRDRLEPPPAREAGIWNGARGGNFLQSPL